MALTKKQIANRKKWVDALRSGKFKQGNGKLKANNKFCCQGVACELFKDDVGGKWKKPDPYLSNLYPEADNVKFFAIGDEWHSEDERDSIWLQPVADLLGVSDDDANQLVRMNDGASSVFHNDVSGVYTISEPATFQEIADAIELLTLAGL